MGISTFSAAGGLETSPFSFTAMLFSFFAGAVLSLWFARPNPHVARTVRGIQNRVALKEPVKMVLVVRKDLKMSAGKIAAQCSHAAVAVFEDVTVSGASTAKEKEEWNRWMEAWKVTGAAKIVLQVDSEDALLTIHHHALEAHVPTYVVADSGRTQIAAGSRTVVAVGPAPVSKVDPITGKLKIL